MLPAAPSKRMDILSGVFTTVQGEPLLGVSIVSLIPPLKSFYTSFQGLKNKTLARWKQ